MPFAFNLIFDPETSSRIERLYAGLAALDISKHDLITHYGPCVTILVVSDRVRPSFVKNVLKLRLPEMGSVPGTLTEPCIIDGTPPALSLRVRPTNELLALHNMVFNELPEEEVHLHYRPAYWQPHVKLANVHGGRAAGARLATRMAAQWHILAGELNALEVLQYPPVQAIWQAPLKSGTAGTRNT